MPWLSGQVPWLCVCVCKCVCVGGKADAPVCPCVWCVSVCGVCLGSMSHRPRDHLSALSKQIRTGQEFLSNPCKALRRQEMLLKDDPPRRAVPSLIVSGCRLKPALSNLAFCCPGADRVLLTQRPAFALSAGFL